MKTPHKFSTQLEPERYELSAQPTYHFGLPRRDFFKVLGGGIVVFCLLDGPLAGQEAGPCPPRVRGIPAPGHRRLAARQ